MLRERLEACRGSEAKAQADARQARADAQEARDATTAALQSRSWLAARIVDANGPGELRAIARDPQVIRWANRAGEAEDPSLVLFGRDDRPLS